MTEAKPNWQLTIQVSDTDALAMILKEPNQFRVVGDIVNLGSADMVQGTASPPPVQAVPPVNGSGREKFPFGSRTEKTFRMKEVIIASITKGRNKFAEMQSDFAKRGHAPGQFQGTLETLKKGGYIAAKGRGVYKLASAPNGAAAA
jgi:hypothetical protein